MRAATRTALMLAAAFACAGAAAQTGLPLRQDSDAATGGMYAAWIIVLAIALGGLWLVRRAKGGRFKWPEAMRTDAGAPRLVASRMLGSNLSVKVVEWNGRQYLLGCAANGVTVIDSRAAGDGS